MRAKVRELVYAVLYAGACGGLVYCCGSSLWRIGDVPGGSQVLFAVMIFFGSYGAYLCGQTSVEILQSLYRRGETDEAPASDETENSAKPQVAAAAVVTGIQREDSAS